MIEAATEAGPSPSRFQGQQLVCQDQEFTEVAEDFGLPVEEYLELAAALRQLGAMRGKDEVIPSIHSIERI